MRHNYRAMQCTGITTARRHNATVSETRRMMMVVAYHDLFSQRRHNDAAGDRYDAARRGAQQRPTTYSSPGIQQLTAPRRLLSRTNCLPSTAPSDLRRDLTLYAITHTLRSPGGKYEQNFGRTTKKFVSKLCQN